MTRPKGQETAAQPSDGVRAEATRAFQVYAYGCSLSDAWAIARLGRWHQLARLSMAIDDFRKRSDTPRHPTEEELSPRELALHLGLAEPKTAVDSKALPWAWWHWSNDLMRERGLGHLTRAPRSVEDLVAGAVMPSTQVTQIDFAK